MRWLTFLVGAMVAGSATAAGSTTFTYQGRLLTKGEPADGLYDLSFRLATNAEGGFLVGKPVELEGVPVVRGLFTVLLDFGPEVLECRDLWLEVAVGKTILKPRQRLTATPYAISAQRVCGTVDVSQITGLLGQGYSLSFPDVLYNRARLEMDKVITRDPVVVLVGPGVDIDRIQRYDGLGRPADTPGFAMEHPLLDANLVEVGRDNYLGCFPLRYEVYEGFGLDTTLTVRVVLSYNRHQPG